MASQSSDQCREMNDLLSQSTTNTALQDDFTDDDFDHLLQYDLERYEEDRYYARHNQFQDSCSSQHRTSSVTSNHDIEQQQQQDSFYAEPFSTTYAVHDFSRRETAMKMNATTRKTKTMTTTNAALTIRRSPNTSNTMRRNVYHEIFPSSVKRFPNSTSKNPQGYLRIWRDGDWKYYFAVLDQQCLRCYEPCNQGLPACGFNLSGSQVIASDSANHRDQIVLSLMNGEELTIQIMDRSMANRWLNAFINVTLNTYETDLSAKAMCKLDEVTHFARQTLSVLTRKADNLISSIFRSSVDDYTAENGSRRFQMHGYIRISTDGNLFTSRYCTCDSHGNFFIYKNRRSLVADRNKYYLTLHLPSCVLSLPSERTENVQFNLIDSESMRTVLLMKGKNVFKMGRVLNILSRYVRIMEPASSPPSSTAQRPLGHGGVQSHTSDITAGIKRPMVVVDRMWKQHSNIYVSIPDISLTPMTSGTYTSLSPVMDQLRLVVDNPAAVDIRANYMMPNDGPLVKFRCNNINDNIGIPASTPECHSDTAAACYRGLAPTRLTYRSSLERSRSSQIKPAKPTQLAPSSVVKTDDLLTELKAALKRRYDVDSKSPHKLSLTASSSDTSNSSRKPTDLSVADHPGPSVVKCQG